MSLTNPKTVITEERLSEFYQKLLPYLGGSADAGFTPVGTVISVMGVTAPANYLACNGQVVNIADYPELANYFYQQFGSKNKFGGNGTTTFGIPDLRGQFLRGTGTNSDTTQGSGEAVGTRQKATQIPYLRTYNAAKTTSNIALVQSDTARASQGNYFDKTSSSGNKLATINTTTETSTTSSEPYTYTTRPTNTSVLFCIATKNIYLNPALDYSTSEKVVGTWIDGKPLYQKTIHHEGAVTGQIGIDVSISNIDHVVDIKGSLVSSTATLPIGFVNISSIDPLTVLYTAPVWYTNGKVYIRGLSIPNTYTDQYITIQYTKTT